MQAAPGISRQQGRRLASWRTDGSVRGEPLSHELLMIPLPWSICRPHDVAEVPVVRPRSTCFCLVKPYPPATAETAQMTVPSGS